MNLVTTIESWHAGLLAMGALGAVLGMAARFLAQQTVGISILAGPGELVGASLGVVAVWQTDSAIQAAAVLAGSVWCMALCATDFVAHRLPNSLTVPGFVAIVGYAAWEGQVSAALIAGVLLAGLYGIVWMISPRSMGAGDVKLALGLGAAAGLGGAAAWLVAAIAAPILTAIWGIASAARTGGRVPHGPSMCIATLGALLLAQ